MQKSIIVLTLAIALLSVGIMQAYAISISGQTRYGGSALGGVKVTAERISEYKYVFSDQTTGNYNLVVDTTNAYSVSGSKAGYQYQSYSNINGGSSLNVILPNSRSYTDIKFKVAYDTDTGITLTAARNYVVSAEPWFRTEHSIDFVETNADAAWTTNGAGTDICGLLTELRNDVNWNSGNYGTAEILIGFTGLATTGTGCINTIPSSGGTHPYITASTSTSDMARTVMHELTHGYGFSHTGTCSNQIPGIMATSSTGSSCSSSIYIKNWTPADDSTMESRRAWY
jgi:hypothetical protein